MPVDTQEKPISEAFRRIDIQKLIIEEPKIDHQNKPFDPSDLIKGEHVEKMTSWLLDRMELLGSDSHNREKMFQLSYLNQDVMPRLHLDALDFEKLIDPNDNLRSDLVTLQKLYPDAYKRVKKPISDGSRLYFKDNMNNWSGGYLENVARWRILSPDEADAFFKDDANTLVAGYSEIVNKDMDFYTFTYLAANLRIAFPKKYKPEILPNDFWKDAHQEIQDCLSNDSWYRLIHFGFYLKVLAAYDIKITENGLELTMGEKQPQKRYNTPPLPEARRF